MNVIDLEKERDKKKYACPECQKISHYCPEWVWKIEPGDEEAFEKLSLEQIMEWLHHTKHLRVI